MHYGITSRLTSQIGDENMYSRYNYNGTGCVKGFLFVSNVNSDELLAQIVEDAKRECWKHNITLEMIGIENNRAEMLLEREAIISLIADLGLGKYDVLVIRKFSDISTDTEECEKFINLMSELGVMLFNMESKVFVKNEYSIGC